MTTFEDTDVPKFINALKGRTKVRISFYGADVSMIT